MKRIRPILQQGWTLVELLIAMAISLLLIAGVGQIYLAAKHSYEVQTSLAEIQDVGRFVVDTLTHDIHMAGYWGLMDINSAATTLVNSVAPGGCPSGNNQWGRMITQKIFGYNDQNPKGNAPNYDCVNSWKRGDVIAVRYADPNLITLPIVGTGTYIRTSPVRGIISSGAPAMPLLWTPVADHAVVAHAFFVRISGQPVDCNGTSVSPPVFERIESANASGQPFARPLVNGVEHLQFQYGVDTDAVPDGSINQYLDADNVGDWNQVRAVRFWVLVRASCPDNSYTDTHVYEMGDLTGADAYTPNDHFRRTLYSSTVALRN